ncbi:MAG TPA: hypothetical protein VKU87_06880 [Thermomicrobiaceae bacterium]|nr:hypothetical protein [Thermomicrobiaceae bacterium]
MLSRIARVESQERARRIERNQQIREAFGDSRQSGLMRRAVGSGLIRAGSWVAGAGDEVEQASHGGRRLSSAG